MKNSELNNLSVEELQQKLKSESADFTKTKLAHGINPLDNPIELRNRRREIARINTAITSKSKQQ